MSNDNDGESLILPPIPLIVEKHPNDSLTVTVRGLPFNWSSAVQSSHSYLAMISEEARRVFQRHGKEELISSLSISCGFKIWVFIAAELVDTSWPEDLQAAASTLLTMQRVITIENGTDRERLMFTAGLQLGWMFAHLRAATPQRKSLIEKGAAYKKAHRIRIETLREQKESEHRYYAQLMDDYFARFPHHRRMTAAKAVKEANDLKVEPITLKRAHKDYGKLKPGSGEKPNRHSD